MTTKNQDIPKTPATNKQEKAKQEEDDEFSKFLKIQSNFDKKRKSSIADNLVGKASATGGVK